MNTESNYIHSTSIHIFNLCSQHNSHSHTPPGAFMDNFINETLLLCRESRVLSSRLTKDSGSQYAVNL